MVLIQLIGPELFVCCLVHRGSTDDLLLLKKFQWRCLADHGLHLSRNTWYLLSPRMCDFIVLIFDLIDNRDDSLTS